MACFWYLEINKDRGTWKGLQGRGQIKGAARKESQGRGQREGAKLKELQGRSRTERHHREVAGNAAKRDVGCIAACTRQRLTTSLPEIRSNRSTADEVRTGRQTITLGKVERGHP